MKKINTSIIQKNIKNKKRNLEEIIFARACCSIGIVIFHYYGHSKGTFKLFFKTANCSWGSMFVTVFFCISGTVLYYNYHKIKSIKAFYFKRWKSIFPSYYIYSIYIYSKNVLKFRALFYRGKKSKLILNIFGLDGYFLYKYKTYYLAGEWFLGAIIIIYILYPILLWSINKNFLVSQLLIYIGYICMYKTNYFIISNWWNIITCTNSFYFGMIFIKLRKYFFMNKIIFIFSFIILVFLCLIRISSFVLIYQIQGFALYIVLIHFGKYIMNTKINFVFKKIAFLSYYIFLVHHRIIKDITTIYNPIEWYSNLLLLGFIIVLTIICSKILSIIITSVINSVIFQKFESLFINYH